jgi:GTPase SAR1 family protein
MDDDGDRDSTLKKPEFMPFMRITVLGMTGSGKTAFINAFINASCPNRYTTTDRTVLYYKKVDVRDEGEFDTILRPILLEVEDTAGSEKGFEGTDVDVTPGADDKGPPRIRKGCRVEVLKDRNKVLAMFNEEKWRGKLEYKKAMDGMLGKEFNVKLRSQDGSIGLPSPDGSEGGIWNFPLEALTLVVKPELPLDRYLSMQKKDFKMPKDPTKKRELAKALEMPFGAYERKIGPPDQDKSLTRNRMGFFICFDLSEEDSASLKEAMKIHTQLKKYLKSRGKRSGEAAPEVMFIGTKKDKTSSHEAQKRNLDSAKYLCDQEDIKVIATSAKTNDSVRRAFHDMVDDIRAKEILWQLQGNDANDDGDDAKEEGMCSLQ